MLGLLLTEAVSLKVDQGTGRNPAGAAAREEPPPPGSLDASATVNKVLEKAPLPSTLKRNLPQVVLSRLMSSLSHITLVLGLIAVGWWHFDRPIIGLAMAVCYLLLPYTRIALVDSGQVFPAALIVGAVVFYDRPSVAGPLIGLAAGWMPACLGLVALWTGFYLGRGAWRFALTALSVATACGLLGLVFPVLTAWARAVGARSLAEIGMFPGVEAPPNSSFWSGIDVYWRLPVLIAYLALVCVTTLWPAGKNLGELIALSAALLVASQFWYLDEGGTLVLLYLPMVILMMFRPTLTARRAFLAEPRGRPARAPAASGR